MSVIASSIKQKEYQINEGLKNKKNEELLRNSYILPNIPVKEIEKADTVSQDSVLPQNFTINQIIKNNPYLKKEIKLNRSEEKINHDSYYDSKYKIDSNHFYEQQRLNKQQKKVRQMKYKEDLEEQIKQKIDSHCSSKCRIFIFIFLNGKFLFSGGSPTYLDYPHFIKSKGKEYADERRRLYSIRHFKEIQNVRSRGWYISKLLW